MRANQPIISTRSKGSVWRSNFEIGTYLLPCGLQTIMDFSLTTLPVETALIFWTFWTWAMDCMVLIWVYMSAKYEDCWERAFNLSRFSFFFFFPFFLSSSSPRLSGTNFFIFWATWPPLLSFISRRWDFHLFFSISRRTHTANKKSKKVCFVSDARK